MYCVYLIKSLRENWVYVGSTGNLDKRVTQHNKGKVTSTKFRTPYKLIYFEEYPTAKEAREREKELKLSRSKKEDILKKLV
ncbi:endonuclease [bacterium]|nr:endonuclease [bacterium]|tara:strand:+ start:24384 stop:24626 length:243 start_codon:yes stop_codon:yes gene_type:complete